MFSYTVLSGSSFVPQRACSLLVCVFLLKFRISPLPLTPKAPKLSRRPSTTLRIAVPSPKKKRCMKACPGFGLGSGMRRQGFRVSGFRVLEFGALGFQGLGFEGFQAAARLTFQCYRVFRRCGASGCDIGALIITYIIFGVSRSIISP